MSEGLLEGYIAERLMSSPDAVAHFEWHGGEPTILGLDYFRRIVALQRKHAVGGRGFTNGIQTNGTFINKDWAAFFADEGFTVGLSLDGPADVHDAYRRTVGNHATHRQAVRAFELLRQYRVHCDILCVLHAANVPTPVRVYKFFHDLGVSHLQLLPLVEGTHDEGPWRPTARMASPAALGEFFCRVFDEWLSRDVGRVTVQFFDEALRPALGLPHALCIFREICGQIPVLEHNGDVYACDHFVEAAHRVGNLSERPLADILNDPLMLAFGERKRDTLPHCCQDCDVLAWCNGGCPKDRVAVSAAGETGLSYLCPAYQRFFRYCRPALEQLAMRLKAGLALGGTITKPPTIRKTDRAGRKSVKRR